MLDSMLVCVRDNGYVILSLVEWIRGKAGGGREGGKQGRRDDREGRTGGEDGRGEEGGPGGRGRRDKITGHPVCKAGLFKAKELLLLEPKLLPTLP